MIFKQHYSSIELHWNQLNDVLIHLFESKYQMNNFEMFVYFRKAVITDKTREKPVRRWRECNVFAGWWSQCNILYLDRSDVE